MINVRKREYDCCVEVSKVCGKTFENIYERRIPGCGVYDTKTSVEEREQRCTEREHANKLNFLIDHKLDKHAYLGPLPPGCGT